MDKTLHLPCCLRWRWHCIGNSHGYIPWCWPRHIDPDWWRPGLQLVDMLSIYWYYSWKASEEVSSWELSMRSLHSPLLLPLLRELSGASWKERPTCRKQCCSNDRCQPTAAARDEHGWEQRSHIREWRVKGSMRTETDMESARPFRGHYIYSILLNDCHLAGTVWNIGLIQILVYDHYYLW